MRGDVIVDHPQQLIHQEAEAAGDIVPGRGRFCQSSGQFRSPRIQCIAQRLDDRRARTFPFCLMQGSDFLGQRAPINDRALAGDSSGAHEWLTRRQPRR